MGMLGCQNHFRQFPFPQNTTMHDGKLDISLCYFVLIAMQNLTDCLFPALHAELEGTKIFYMKLLS